MERSKELSGSAIDRMIIQYSNSTLKLASVIKNSEMKEVTLQKYERLEYPWSRREKYKKKKNSKPKVLREFAFDSPNLKAIFPTPLLSAPSSPQFLQPVQSSDKFFNLEKVVQEKGSSTRTPKTRRKNKLENPRGTRSSQNSFATPGKTSIKTILIKAFPSPSRVLKLQEVEGMVNRLTQSHRKSTSLDRDVGNIVEERSKPIFTSRIIDLTAKHMKRLEDRDIADENHITQWTPSKLPSSTCMYATKLKITGEYSVLPSSAIIPWKELQRCPSGSVVVTIEHCCDCIKHTQTMNHREAKYRNLADATRNAIAAAVAQYSLKLDVLTKPVSVWDEPATEPGANLSQERLKKKGNNSSLNPHLPNNVLGVDCTNRLVSILISSHCISSYSILSGSLRGTNGC